MKVLIRAFALPLLLLVPGCKAKQEKITLPPPAAAPAGQMGHGAMPAGPKKESVVVVPESQKGKFKAIKITVTDLASKKETSVAVPLGTDFVLPGTGLTMHVDNLLPDFGMGEGVITSRTDKMNNPAAQIKVTEAGKEVFKGWLFSLYPDAHPFEHPKYGVKLVDFVAAK
jgi:hypothetical protein